MRIDGTINGLSGTILNHLQQQERECRVLQCKYKKVVKQNEELQATASGAMTVKRTHTNQSSEADKMAMTCTKRTKSSESMQAVNRANSTGPSKNTRTAKKTRKTTNSATLIKVVVKTKEVATTGKEYKQMK